MSAPDRLRHRSKGVTLIELLASTVITAAILAALAAAVQRSLSSSDQSTRLGDLDRKAQNAVDKIVMALRDAGKTTLSACAPPTGSFSLTSQESAGFAGGNVVWENAQVVEWQPSPTDPVNGVDNDGNGLIDDGMVVWRRNSGLSSETKTILVREVPYLAPGETTNSADDNADGLVDERGLSFSRTGNALRIRLTLARRQPNGTIATRTTERTVALCN